MKNSLIIILFDHPWEHTADYACQTSACLSRHNTVVGLLLKDSQSIKEIITTFRKPWLWRRQGDNFYLFKPVYIIPFRRHKQVERINVILNMIIVRVVSRFLFWQKKIRATYIWIFNPEHAYVRKVFSSGTISVYDCVDYHGHELTRDDERRLVRQSSWVFVNSETLYAIHRPVRRDIQKVPLGFNLSLFRVNHKKSSIRLPHRQPIIGYVGGINPRLDFALLFRLMQHNPQWNFVFVGPVQVHGPQSVFRQKIQPAIDRMLGLPNVYWYPSVSKRLIPSLIWQFDIGMVPYDPKLPFNIYSFPMKILEYFYCGKPVLSTPIRELKRFPIFVTIAETPGQWELAIKRRLSGQWPDEYKKQQRDIAVVNSWEQKIASIEAVMT